MYTAMALTFMGLDKASHHCFCAVHKTWNWSLRNVATRMAKGRCNWMKPFRFHVQCRASLRLQAILCTVGLVICVPLVNVLCVWEERGGGLLKHTHTHRWILNVQCTWITPSIHLICTATALLGRLHPALSILCTHENFTIQVFTIVLSRTWFVSRKFKLFTMMMG